MKRVGVSMLFVICVMFALPQECPALRLLNTEAALAQIFGKKAEIITETKELTDEVLSAIKSRLGGTLVYFQKGSESRKVLEERRVNLFFAVKNGRKYGVALVDVEPGKWGPVEFMIAMDLKGVVKSVKVMSYEEKRGRPIARRSFTGQYRGKDGKSPLIVGKDITGISGATISSRSATFAVKKAIVLYEELYLRK